ncbi:type II toxin-antitoxin system VapC family toxin [Candidatus Nitrospira inopinata]|jgi:predicted nucleic acid-binding protein|uniref:Ribonuclease VapC n=1 Tax=Candidatus Nitrospira inopinata TaxID=1715989 RepID=A0A0S4KXM8_9BACT|nr:PIN domain-containing protein [Candidatus Nitrospira inopinata]CUQ68080.1 putative enzyme [Candidatus Nitrospira inopinata]
MYLVDTSVWIHALRPTGHAEIQARLKPLIINAETSVTEWILLELLTGLTKSERPSSLLQWFTPVPLLQFHPDWWNTAWQFAGRLRKHGISPSAADCLIATIAIEHHVTLIHCDADFEAMKPIIPLETLDWTKYLHIS